jgi:hypothetical protein
MSANVQNNKYKKNAQRSIKMLSKWYQSDRHALIFPAKPTKTPQNEHESRPSRVFRATHATAVSTLWMSVENERSLTSAALAMYLGSDSSQVSGTSRSWSV